MLQIEHLTKTYGEKKAVVKSSTKSQKFSFWVSCSAGEVKTFSVWGEIPTWGRRIYIPAKKNTITLVSQSNCFHQAPEKVWSNPNFNHFHKRIKP